VEGDLISRPGPVLMSCYLESENIERGWIHLAFVNSIALPHGAFAVAVRR
jgi:hypothetical protein